MHLTKEWDRLHPYVKSVSETNEPPRGKTNNVISEQVRHKLGCTATEDGQRLEILDLESRGIVLSV